MTDKRDEPNELQKLHDNIESVRAIATDTAVGALNAVPLVGGPLAAWLSQFQQRELFKRLLIVLEDAVIRIRVLESRGNAVNVDDEYIEFISEVGILAARTRSEDKRQHFSNLIATGAIRFDTGMRDRGKMMALLLDRLDPGAVLAFLKLMTMPSTQSVHGFWGAYRPLNVKWGDDFPGGSGKHLQVLAAHGLLELGAFRENRTYSFEVTVTDFGIEFFEWIRSDAI
jgi:hypothetical protein